MVISDKKCFFILVFSGGFLRTSIWMRDYSESPTLVYCFGLWRCHVLKILFGVHTGVHKMLFLNFLVYSALFVYARIVPQNKKAAICGFDVLSKVNL